MGHLGKYGFLKKTKKTYDMLNFIVSYGHIVIISQKDFSLCDKYNSYVHFFQIVTMGQKKMKIFISNKYSK